MQLEGPSTYMQHAKGSDMLIDSQLMTTKTANQNNRMKVMGSSGHMVAPAIMGNDPRVSQQSSVVDHRQVVPPSHRHYLQNSAQQPPVNAQMRSNLITVPIQDTTTTAVAAAAALEQSHHYYHTENHINSNMTARYMKLLVSL